MMALYESEESESLNETLVAQGVARVASNADKLATSQVRRCIPPPPLRTTLLPIWLSTTLEELHLCLLLTCV